MEGSFVAFCFFCFLLIHPTPVPGFSDLVSLLLDLPPPKCRRSKKTATRANKMPPTHEHAIATIVSEDIVECVLTFLERSSSERLSGWVCVDHGMKESSNGCFWSVFCHGRNAIHLCDAALCMSVSFPLKLIVGMFRFTTLVSMSVVKTCYR